MIDLETVRKTIATYRKHGWNLRRILIVDNKDAARAAELQEIAEVPVVNAVVDAAWFSRPKKDGPVAWEIRYLGETSFALLQSLDETDPDFEHSLREMESRLEKAMSSKKAP